MVFSANAKDNPSAVGRIPKAEGLPTPLYRADADFDLSFFSHSRAGKDCS
jgi:hypothetical protein